MATRKKAPKAKPTKRADRRKTTSTRITPETRAKLEATVAQSGRSLAQEIELRLQQSFLDENARDREFGGKKLRGLFRMMTGALEIIEQGRGKACTDDWGSFSAIKEAWGVLFFMTLAPKDQPSGEHSESMGKPSEHLELPFLPIPPKYPASEKEQRTYEAEREDWNRVASEFQTKFDAAQQHMDDMKRLGEKTVIEMFYTGARD